MIIVLIIAVRRCVAETQPSERELQCCGVAKEELRGNVQEKVVPFLILVIQGTRRHLEEILRGQTEGVRCGGGDRGSCLYYGNAGCYSTFPSKPLTFNMIRPTVDHYTTRTVVAVMPCIKYQDRSAFLAARFHGNNPVLPVWWSILLLTSGDGGRHYPNG